MISGICCACIYYVYGGLGAEWDYCVLHDENVLEDHPACSCFSTKQVPA